MKLIKKIKIILLAMFSLLSVSCLDDSVTDFGEGPIVVQFPTDEMSQNFLQDDDNTVYDFEIPVQYFGGNNVALNEEVTVTIAINTDKTTATDGVEFSLPETQFTIPANANSANVSIKVNSESLDSQDPKIVALEITDSSQKASSNKNIILLTLQAICPSEHAGTYKYKDLGGRTKTVEVTATGPGTYTVSAGNIFGGNYPYNISDVCDNITITGGYLEDNFSIPVSGGGTRDPITGDITLRYTAEGYFANREMILQKQ